jgi:hypothetical protein
MGLQAGPLLRGEFHAFPVVKAGFILLAELYPPGLVNGALGFSNMSLELHRVCPSPRSAIDISMGLAKAAIMGLGYFGDYSAGSTLFWRQQPMGRK